MKKVLALLLALACALPLGVAAAAATGDAIPYPNIGLVVESDLCDGDGAVYSAADVIALFDSLHECGHTIVLITHDPAAARRATRRLRLENGVLFNIQ